MTSHTDNDIPKSSDNVVDLPSRPTELRPPGSIFAELVVDNTGKHCQHYPVIVDRYQRRAYCGTCKAPLDAFDELLRLAQSNARIAEERASAKVEVRAAEERLKLLRRLEQNAKARVKKYGLRTDGHHLDAVIEWGLRHIKKRNPKSDVTADQLANRLQYERFERRLAIALQAIEDGAGLAAVELAGTALEELRASLESRAEEPDRAVKLQAVKGRRTR